MTRMQTRSQYENFFISMSGETQAFRRNNTFYIDKNMPSEPVKELQLRQDGILPSIHILGGAQAESIQAIPAFFNSVVLCKGADGASSSQLPYNITIAEIYDGIEPSAVADISKNVIDLIFTGSSAEIMQSIPARYLQIALRRDITPHAVSSLPAHVERIKILGAISAESLKSTPPSVNTVFFNKNSFHSWNYIGMYGEIVTAGKQFLGSLPIHVRALGVSGEMELEFLQCMPPHINFMMVENIMVDNDKNKQFAKSIPPQIKKLLIYENVSVAFINAVPLHTELACVNKCSGSIKEHVTKRNLFRQAYLNELRNRLKRQAEGELDSDLTPREKKFRPGS